MKCTVIESGKCDCGAAVTLAKPLDGDGSVMVIHSPRAPARNLSVRQVDAVLRMTLPIITDIKRLPPETLRLGKATGKEKKASALDVLEDLLFGRRPR